MIGCNNAKCINPGDVNETLKNVFKFIVQNQVYFYGYLQETSVLLKISLTSSQFPTTPSRESAQNIVVGVVTEISDTYVVMLAKRGCEVVYSEYTIEYEKIIYLINPIFSNRYAQFKEYLYKKTPNLCYEKDNQYLDLLESLRLDLIKYKDDKTKDIKIIFSGVNSRIQNGRAVEIIRNILLLEQAFIFPITSISGYIFTPNCNDSKEFSKDKDEDKIEEDIKDKKEVKINVQ